MRAIIRILIAIVLLVGAGLQVALAGIQETVEQTCRDYVLRQTQWAPEDVELVFRRYILPSVDWTGVTLQVEHAGNADLCGPTSLKVIVLHKGLVLRTFPVSVEIGLFDSVLVTTHRLLRKDVLGAADVVLERRKVDLGADPALKSLDEVIGYRVRRSLSASTVLTRSAIEENPLVLQGEKVTIRYQTAHLLMTAVGEAIEDGWKDRPVRVKNLASKKLVMGIPVEHGVIEALRPNSGG